MTVFLHQLTIRRLFSGLLLGLALLLFGQRAQASHILGGEMTYTYVGFDPATLQFQYQIKLNVLVDGNPGSVSCSTCPNPGFVSPGAGSNTACISIYDSLTRQRISTASQTVNPRLLAKPVPSGCIPPSCLDAYQFYLSEFVYNVSIPFVPGSTGSRGYVIGWGLSARTADFTNLQNPGSTGNSFVQTIPSPLITTQNSSPQFTDVAAPFLFSNESTSFVNSAFDPDGDRLIYQYVTPYSNFAGGGGPGGGCGPAIFPLNIPTVTFLTTGGFSLATPFGAGGTCAINAATGLSTFLIPNIGLYAVSIEILEYRTLANGSEVLIGRTRRELSLYVRAQGNGPGQCPVNQPPTLADQNGAALPSQITIASGQSLSFQVRGADPEALFDSLKASGNIIDGTLGYTGPRATFTTVSSGPGGERLGTFTWNTSCILPGTYPITIRATDKGCPQKSQQTTIAITVSPFRGPLSITGTNATCSNQTYTYSVDNLNPTATRTWRVVGGTFTSSPNNTTNVGVRWTSTTGQLIYRSVSSFGCKDSVVLNINNLVTSGLDAGANRTICAEAQTTLTVTPVSGVSSYSWTTTTGSFVGSGTSVNVTPPTTTSYVVNGSNSLGCQLRDTVVITVVPRAAPSLTVTNACAGTTATIGNAAVSGYTYSWSPAGGLLDPLTGATNRFVTPNITSGILDVTYIRTTTGPNNCVFQDNFRVVVSPPPAISAGSNKTICSGGNTTIGETSNPNNTLVYSWSPTTGLTTPNSFSSAVTAVNNTDTPQLLTYVLTGQLAAGGCVTRDTMTLLVNPLPRMVNTSTTVCANVASQYPETPVSGVTYSWSPAIGLSATNIANPTITLGTLGTQTYNVTTNNTSTGCSNVQTVTVTVSSVIKPNLGRDTTICSTVPLTLASTLSIISGATYQWTPSTGLSNPNILNPTLTLTNSGTTVQGPFQYILTVTSGANCIGRDTILISVAPSSIADAGRDTNTCANVPVTIGSAPNLPGYSYAWTPTTGLSSPNVSNPTLTLGTPGTYTYRLRANAPAPANICPDFDTVIITIKALPTLVASSTTTVCSATSAIAPVTPAARPARYRYRWNTRNGLSDSTIANPNILLVNTTTSPIVVNYTLTVFDSASNCTNTFPLAVTVQPAPEVRLLVNYTVCSGVNAPFARALGSNFTTAVSFISLDAGLTFEVFKAPNSPDPAFDYIRFTNSTNVSILARLVRTVTDLTTGCQNAATMLITVHPLPVADAGIDKTVCPNATVTLGTAASSGLVYSWSPGRLLVDSIVAQPVYRGVNSTNAPVVQTFVLTVRNTLTTCIRRDTVNVNVLVSPSRIALPTQYTCNNGVVSIRSATGGDFIPSRTLSFSTVTPLPTGVTITPTTGLPGKFPSYLVTSNRTDTGIVKIAYTVRDSVTNCQQSVVDTVLIKIEPRTTVDAGNGQDTVTVCSGAPFVLGSASNPSGSYRWNTRFGLSDSTVARPTVAIPYTGAGFVTFKYFMTYTSNRGACQSRDSVVVKVIGQLKIDVGRRDSVCRGSVVTLGPAVPLTSHTYRWKPGRFLNDSTIANPVFTAGATVPTNVLFNVIATNTVTGCKDSATLNMRVRELPVAINWPDAVICRGDTASLGGRDSSYITYSWSLLPLPSGVTANLLANTTSRARLTAVHNQSTAQTVSVAYTVTDTRTGCNSRPDTLNVRVNQLPQYNLPTGVVVCQKGQVQIGTTPRPNSSYVWRPGRLLNDSLVAQPQFIKTDSAGPEVFTLQLTDLTTGCKNTFTQSVTVNPLPSANAGRDTALCNGTTTILGANAFNAIFRYSWSPAINLSSDTLAQPTFTAINLSNTAFTQRYILTMTNRATRCVKMDTVNVTVNPTPRIDLGADQFICFGDSLTVVPSSFTFTKRVTFWGIVQNPNVTVSIDANRTNDRRGRFIVSNNTGLAQTFKVFARQDDSTTKCAGFTDTLNVTVRPPIVYRATTRDTIPTCNGVPAKLGSVADTTNLTFQWGPAGDYIGSTTVSRPIVSVSVPGLTSPQFRVYTVRIRNTSTGCEVTRSGTLRIEPLPQIPLNQNAEVCDGDSISIGVQAQTGFTYLWRSGFQLKDSVAATTLLKAKLADPRVSETRRYRLRVTNVLTGCTDTAGINVRINALPPVTRWPDLTICSGDTFNFGVQGTRTSYRFVPSLDAGLVASVTLDVNTGERKLTVSNTTSTTITQLVRQFNFSPVTNCSNVDTFLLTVLPAPAVFAASQDTVTTCSQVPLQLGGSGQPGVRYRWDVATGMSPNADTTSNPTVTLSNTNAAPRFVRYLLRATNRVTNCSALDTVVVRVNPEPVFTLINTTDSICSGSSVTIGTTPVAGFTYRWSSKQFLSDSTIANPVFSTTIPKDAAQLVLTRTIVVTNAVTNCTTTRTVTLKVNSLPTSTAGPDVQVCSGESVRLGAVSIATRSYLWSPDSGLSSRSVSNPVLTRRNFTANVRVDTLVLRTTTLASGCFSLDTVLVRVVPKPARPNLFSPSNAVCPNSIGLIYEVRNPVAGVNYTWRVSGGNITANNGTSIVVTWGVTNPNAFVRVFATNSLGCAGDSATVGININQRLYPARPIGDTTICYRGGLTYRYIVPTTVGSVYTYRLIGNGQIVNSSTNGIVDVRWNGTGRFRLYVEEVSVTSTDRCTGFSDTTFVTINPSPDSTLTISGNANPCLNSTVTYNVPVTRGSTYTWSVVPATTGVSFTGQGTSIINLTSTVQGNFQLVVVETNIFGCVGKQIDTVINIRPIPATTLSGVNDYNVCPTTRRGRFYIANGLPGSTFNWTIRGGVINNSGPFTNGNDTIRVDWNPRGPFSLSVVETSQYACGGTVSITLPINVDSSGIQILNATRQFISDSLVNVTFNATGQAATGTNNVTILRREVGQTNFVAIANVNGGSGLYVDNTAGRLRSYEYTIRTTNVCGVPLSDSIINTILLQGAASQTSTQLQLSWNEQRGLFRGVKEYNIWRKLDNGDWDSTWRKVEPSQLAFLDFSGGDGFVQQFKVQAIGNDGQRNFSNTVVLFFENKLADKNNVITPNGDGKNDFLLIESAKLYGDNTFRVYNRYGRLVYTKDNYSKEFEATDLPGGTYFWMLDAKGGPASVPVQLVGWVEVIRD